MSVARPSPANSLSPQPHVSYYLPAYATPSRAVLAVIPVVLHIRICDARLPPWWRQKGFGPGGVAGEGAQGGPGGLLAGPDRPQPRGVLLRPRRVTRSVRGQRRRHRRPGR